MFVTGADHHSCCGIGNLNISDRCAYHRGSSDRVSLRGSFHHGWTHILCTVRPLRNCTIFHGWVQSSKRDVIPARYTVVRMRKISWRMTISCHPSCKHSHSHIITTGFSKCFMFFSLCAVGERSVSPATSSLLNPTIIKPPYPHVKLQIFPRPSRDRLLICHLYALP